MLPFGANTMLRRVAEGADEGISELLWPTRCVGCNLPGGLLCEECEQGLDRIERRWRCPVCGAPYGWLTCTACGRDWEELNGCACALSYGGTASRLVSTYKDGHERRLAPIIARLMEEAILVECDREGSAFDAIAFVPATARAFARRGFDHMQPIADELSRSTGIPVVDALVREEGLDQRRLGREERSLNLEGRVSVMEDVADMAILLIDDVITTGASIRACAGALKKRGASEVFGLALARVW